MLLCVRRDFRPDWMKRSGLAEPACGRQALELAEMRSLEVQMSALMSRVQVHSPLQCDESLVTRSLV